MTCQLISSELTDEQKGRIFGILSVGCDRQTAAHIVGCSLGTIRRTMQHDEAFAAGVCRAEAGAELSHMRTIQQAAKDEKHWRASVWWLERRSPERFGPRGPGVVTTRQLKAFAEVVADAIRTDVRNEEDRNKIVARLQSLAASIEQWQHDQQLKLGDEQAKHNPSPESSALEDERAVDGNPDDINAVEVQ